MKLFTPLYYCVLLAWSVELRADSASLLFAGTTTRLDCLPLGFTFESIVLTYYMCCLVVASVDCVIRY